MLGGVFLIEGTNNLHFKVLFALSDLGGSASINELGVKIARGENETSELLEETKRGDSLYKLRPKFRKRIIRALRSLSEERRVYKVYFDLNGELLGTEVNEEDIFKEHKKYLTKYNLHDQKLGISNYSFLKELGIQVIFNENIFDFRCEIMGNTRESNNKEVRLLFINDYKRGVYLKLSKLELPARFIIIHDLKYLENVEARLKKDPRTVLIKLSNTSYNIAQNYEGYIEIITMKDGSFNIINHLESSINIGSDIGVFPKEQIVKAKNVSELSDCGEVVLNKKCRSIDLPYSIFTPIYFEYLQYVLVLE